MKIPTGHLRFRYVDIKFHGEKINKNSQKSAQNYIIEYDNYTLTNKKTN